MSAVTSTSTRRRGRLLSDCVVVIERNIRHIPRVPDRLAGATIGPVMFVFLFAYVFGSAIAIPGGGSYREFLLAGIFVQTISFSGAYTAVGVSDDMQKGLVDRFRSLPMARSAVLIGRTVADLVQSGISVVVMSACGLIVGWRIHDGVLRAVLAFALLLLFGFAMSWLGTLAGLYVRSPEAANQLGFVAIFPLTFVANTFVPTAGMPPLLRTLADWNPVSATTAAARQLFGNPQPPSTGAWPMDHPVMASVGWSLLILAVVIPLAVRRYRLATSR